MVLRNIRYVFNVFIRIFNNAKLLYLKINNILLQYIIKLHVLVFWNSHLKDAH